jgi:PAS domain S-box-containing protein
MAEAEGVQGARRASATVRQHRALLEAILDRMGSQVFVKDLDGRYLLVNRQIALEAGVAHDEMIGRTDAELFPGSATDVWRANDLAVVAGRVPVEYEEEFEHPDGVQTFLSQKFPLLDAAGEPYALGGVSTNITERKRTEQAVIAANQAKSAFLSRMSHELRTPLNAVMGFAQLLQMDELTAHQHDAVGEILHGARHLLELINEVLDIARIESGHFAISLGDVVLDDVVDEVARLMRPMAERRRIALDADVAGACGLVVRADRQRLKQVLLNLVSNAVKYTPEGGTVRLRSATDGDRVTVLVTDTGAGIAAADIERLFVPFERLGAERSTIEGSGLGLALAKSLVEAMHGTIEVDSAPGAGSTFGVTLAPARAALTIVEDLREECSA